MVEISPRQTRILIADDEEEIRFILLEYLSEEYECQAVDSAESAVRLLERERFNLIISDVMMPGMTGLQLIPHVAAVSPNTLVILVSGAQVIENAIEALRVGAFDYLLKPFDLRQVSAVIKRAITHQKLLEDKRRYENYLEELVVQRTAQLDTALDSLDEAYRSTLKSLVAALETRDAETHGHSERVVNYSLRLARALGLDQRELRALEFGSLLHDIGKIGVPDAVLRKPSRLDEHEWAQMKEHPVLGQQILRGIDFLQDALAVVSQHHERWDGAGYPAGLRGAEIDIKARIFAVADAYDAMTSDRVYRKGKSFQQAVDELDRCAGEQFDPQIVQAFHSVSQTEWETLSHTSSLSLQQASGLKSFDAAASPTFNLRSSNTPL